MDLANLLLNEGKLDLNYSQRMTIQNKIFVNEHLTIVALQLSY